MSNPKTTEKNGDNRKKVHWMKKNPSPCGLIRGARHAGTVADDGGGRVTQIVVRHGKSGRPWLSLYSESISDIRAQTRRNT